MIKLLLIILSLTCINTYAITEESPQNNVVDTEKNETTNKEDLPKLKELIIDNYKIDFKPDVNEYKIDVEEDVTKLNIKVKSYKTSDLIDISSNAYDLKTGENKVQILVLDTEGKKNIYKIIVTKKENLSNNNFLSKITVDGYEFNFAPAITDYTLEIKNDKMLSINAVVENKKAKYEIIGNNDLKDGSKVIIRVTAEDSSKRDYTINIVKKFNILDYKFYIVGVLLVLLVILLFIIKKQKKGKKTNKIEEVKTPVSTVGTVKTVKEEVKVEEPVVKSDTNTVVPLKIIEPTNIEKTDSVEEKKEDTDNNTEVFKL